jgi:hypothetical protein
MSDPNQAHWELVNQRRDGDYTERLQVPGGWLYRTSLLLGDVVAPAVAMTFVPEARS